MALVLFVGPLSQASFAERSDRVHERCKIDPARVFLLEGDERTNV
jgi:hypothetical protein